MASGAADRHNSALRRVTGRLPSMAEDSRNPATVGPDPELVRTLNALTEAAARVADLVERQVVPTLVRIAEALEQSITPRVDLQAVQARVEVRRAIEQGLWLQAERLAEAFARDYPGDRE